MKLLRLTVIAAIILAFLVVMLGAFTRLTDAGLGCPDWPGCYGRMALPSQPKALESAQQVYPQIPIESRKAWTEMIHRYAAGTLVILILGITIQALILRNSHHFVRNGQLRLFLSITYFLLLLIAFQAALGMWTVTLKLLPIVVMGHLLGGILIFTCLSCLWWQVTPVQGEQQVNWRFWINLGLFIVFCQIALGGWVSSNYAGIACIGFPTCNGQWLPSLDFTNSFNFFSPIGANYQGGLLDNQSRVTIQMVHRLGAVVTALYVISLSGWIAMHARARALRVTALMGILFVLVQFALGVANVVFLLPLAVAVAHNGVAALLLATMASLRYFVSKGALHARRT